MKKLALVFVVLIIPGAFAGQGTPIGIGGGVYYGNHDAWANEQVSFRVFYEDSTGAGHSKDFWVRTGGDGWWAANVTIADMDVSRPWSVDTVPSVAGWLWVDGGTASVPGGTTSTNVSPMYVVYQP